MIHQFLCVVYFSPSLQSQYYKEYFDKIRDVSLSIPDNSKLLIVGEFNLPKIHWDTSDDGILPSPLNHTPCVEEYIELYEYWQFQSTQPNQKQI